MEPQETPFLWSITENLENTAVDQPADDDSQSIIRDIQIENEWLRKEIHQVTTLKENFKLELEKLTHRISVQEARVFTIDRFESDKDVTFYTGFPNRIVIESVFEFLDTGNKGETQVTGILMTQLLLIITGVMKMPQARKTKTVKPKGRIFLTLCRLRQGFKVVFRRQRSVE